jgi:hypothetical protein
MSSRPSLARLKRTNTDVKLPRKSPLVRLDVIEYARSFSPRKAEERPHPRGALRGKVVKADLAPSITEEAEKRNF